MNRFSFLNGMIVTCGLVVLLGGCADTSAWLRQNGLYGRGATVPQEEEIPKGELTIPKAAPVPPVEKRPLGSQPTAALPPNTSGKTKVALLLPLSGSSAALGQAMLNAAQQAVFDIAPQNFELMPRDTGGSNEQVDMSTREAVANGAQLLIGPLFAAQVPIVHNAAQMYGLNMLTLSTDRTLAAPGVFVMGFAPDAQVDRVMRFAVGHGVRRIAALVPDNAYGNLVGQAVRTSLDRAGGALVAIGAYNTQQHNTANYARELASHRDVIDGLLLPESGAELTPILNQLVSAGFDFQKTRLLGTGLWDAPDFGRQNALAVGGWYATSDPSLRQKFIETYKATYGQEPPRLVTLAYDATALAAVLTKRNAPFDQASLTNPNGFAGLDGIFRLTSNGLVERGLAVLQVESNGARVIDPAPTTFAVGSP